MVWRGVVWCGVVWCCAVRYMVARFLLVHAVRAVLGVFTVSQCVMRSV